MKRTIFILICSIALFTTTSRICLAQNNEENIGIGIKISHLTYLGDWSIPHLKLEADDDVALGINITYNFTKRYSLEISFDYTKTDLDSNLQRFDLEEPSSLNLDLGEFKQIPVLLTGRIHIYSNNWANIYLGAGLGYYFHSFNPNISVDENIPWLPPHEHDFDVDNNIGYHIGGGVEIYISDNFSFIFDLKHLWNKADLEGTLLFDTDSDVHGADLALTITDEDNEEIDLDTFSIGVGFKYYF